MFSIKKKYLLLTLVIIPILIVLLYINPFSNEKKHYGNIGTQNNGSVNDYIILKPDPMSEPMLKVYLDYTPAGQSYLNKLNEKLYTYGFNMGFFVQPREYESFKDFVNTRIDDAYTVFVPNESASFGIEHELTQNGLLGDFYELGMKIAPNYTAKDGVRAFNEPESLRYMAMRIEEKTPFLPAVLVREDVNNAYGLEIRNAAQFEGLLRWQKNQNSNSTPCITVSESFHLSMAYGLFLPQWGYQIDTFHEDNFLVVYGIQDNMSYPIYELSETKWALEEYLRLIDDGLIRVASYTETPRLNDYPIILTNAYLYLNTHVGSYLGSVRTLYNFDASRYRMHILYPDTLTEYVKGHSYNVYNSTAIAGLNTNPSELLRFLEWIEDEKNYRLMFYGNEGADYFLNESGTLEWISSQNFNTLLDASGFFSNSAFNYQRANMPRNYLSELNAYRFVNKVVVPNESIPDIYEGDFYDVFSDYRQLLFYNNNYRSIFDDYREENSLRQTNLLEEYFNNARQERGGLINFYSETINELIRSAINR